MLVACKFREWKALFLPEVNKVEPAKSLTPFVGSKEITMMSNLQLDAKGLSCPMPIVKTKKAMDTLVTGEILEVQVTDKGALADIPAWAKAGGHVILDQSEVAGVITFLIQKA
ncbi:TusA-related sulfurtransferase [Lysinibacillus sp. TC-37]|nr:TusA-related sulfurtransferase [Lysinibacillus sp. SG9]SDB37414.1 TusA-related sulfurtransferase [Lysinibacillus sp. TC-37]SFS79162.1 TusA-related sulfurtransferase [Lysinibacillus sp. SG55]